MIIIELAVSYFSFYEFQELLFAPHEIWMMKLHVFFFTLQASVINAVYFTKTVLIWMNESLNVKTGPNLTRKLTHI